MRSPGRDDENEALRVAFEQLEDDVVHDTDLYRDMPPHSDDAQRIVGFRAALWTLRQAIADRGRTR